MSLRKRLGGTVMKVVDGVTATGEKRKMWQAKLNKVYDSFAEFKAYDEIYGIANRIGFATAVAAWRRNPTIRGSVHHSDLQQIN